MHDDSGDFCARTAAARLMSAETQGSERVPCCPLAPRTRVDVTTAEQEELRRSTSHPRRRQAGHRPDVGGPSANAWVISLEALDFGRLHAGHPAGHRRLMVSDQVE